MKGVSKKSDKEKSVQFKGQRYEVNSPWKNKNNALSSNYDQLIKKFKTNVPLYNQCREVIQEYVSQGIVECVENVTTDHCNPIFHTEQSIMRSAQPLSSE